MSEYVCSRCGASCYYDGRCGDGPILTCGCDSEGPDGRPLDPQYDSRMGSVNVYYNSDAHPVKKEESW